MVHGDARERKWRRNWRMQWVASTLHTTSEHGVSSITTADAHTSAASSRLSWRPRRFKWTRPFRRKKKSGFCACAITFQLASNCSTARLGTRQHALGRLLDWLTVGVNTMENETPIPRLFGLVPVPTELTRSLYFCLEWMMRHWHFNRFCFT